MIRGLFVEAFAVEVAGADFAVEGCVVEDDEANHVFGAADFDAVALLEGHKCRSDLCNMPGSE